MRVLRNLTNHTPGAAGEVKLCPHDADDMWNLYNLITIGDVVSSKTTRKIVKAGTGAQAKSSSERLTINKLPVMVTTIDWDGTTNQIRISGTVPDIIGGYAGENIKKGQFHTLQLEINENVYVEKKSWDSHDLDQLRNATSQYKDVSAAAVVMHLGLAHVCLITRTMCPTIAKIELSIPKKRAVSNQQSSIDKFFTYVAEALSQLPTSISCFIIAGPAFVGMDFFEFLKTKYADKYKWLFPITRKMHASSGHKHALLEALSDGSLGSILVNSGLDIERAAMDEFLNYLNTHPYRVYYGLKDVNTIITEHSGSIKTLMMSDSLFKDEDPVQRKAHVALADAVKVNGGNVLIFSSLNPTSEPLKQLTGIACILNYDIEDLQNDQEFIALENYINTALDISPLEFPHQDNCYSFGSSTDAHEPLDEFICLPGGIPRHAVAVVEAVKEDEKKESSKKKEKKSSKKDKKSAKSSSPEEIHAFNSDNRHEDIGDFL